MHLFFFGLDWSWTEDFGLSVQLREGSIPIVAVIFFVIIGFSNENCCTLHKSEDKFLTTLRIVHKTRLTLANVTKIDDYDQFGFF